MFRFLLLFFKISYKIVGFFMKFYTHILLPSPVPSLSKDLRLLYFHLSEMLAMGLKLGENEF